MFLRLVSLSLLVLFAPLVSQATLFRNAYVSFELTPNWDCKLDGTEWVCVSKYATQSKEAIIILTAKEVGPTDSLDAYMSHLKTPRSIPDKSGKMTMSKVIDTRNRLIGNHPWVDGMQMGSEIASYYTRYLATVKDRLAILVTFSAHNEHFTKYSNDFLKAVESLRVVAAKDILSDTSTSKNTNMGKGIVGMPIVDQQINLPDSNLPPEPQGQDMKTKLFALALLLGAIGFYLWRRKKS